ncbi:MAG: hypothetical protein WDZ90_02660 [Candidatus Paceibacterota bacterium]
MMNKTILISIIATFVLLLAGMFGFFYFYTDTFVDRGGEQREGAGGFFSNLFPFGDSGGADIQRDDTRLDSNEEDLSGIPAPALRKVTSAHTSGAVIFVEEGEETIRYVERGTGHIYEASTNSLRNERILNTTIPRVREVLWLPDGSGLYFRYLEEGETITTFFARIEETEEGENELVGSFLPQDIVELSLAPDGEEIFYMTRNESGARGVIADVDGRNGREIFESPLREWHAFWSSPTSIFLVSRPSYLGTGIYASLNSGNGSFSSLGGGGSGFSILPNTEATSEERLFLASQNRGERVSLSVLGEDGERALPLRTLAEKCVWSEIEKSVAYCGVPTSFPEGNYPDDWYQGEISFIDSIWKVNTEAQSAELISLVSNEAGESLDAINLTLSPSEKYLLFKNKQNGSLWSLRLVEEDTPQIENLEEEDE